MKSSSRIVEFDSGGETIRGWLYEPERPDGLTPGIVMLHGFSATATGMVADQYAEAFAEIGVAALLIDPRGFGLSDGEPRHIANEWQQARDVIAGIDHLTGSNSVDPKRIGVWGDSIGGGVAVVVAAVDSRVQALAVQVPGFGEEILPADNDGSWFETIRNVLAVGDLDSYGRESINLPVVSSDQEAAPSHIPTLTAYHWFINYGARYGTNWYNRATYELLDTPRPFESQPCVPHVQAPILMVIAEDDEVPAANSNVARHCYANASEPKELLELDGGHFGLLYHDSPEFHASVEAQQDFLQRVLVNQDHDR